MKTKQTKEELDKTLDEDIKEPKTRARKKASDANDEGKQSQDEPKTSKDKKTQSKPRAVVKKRPLGIRKALRSKKTAIVKEKVKNVIKQKAKRGRKPAIKPDPDVQDKDAAPLIPASDIKKEPGEEASSNSRSESPKTGRSQREMAWLMKHNMHVLNDSPSARACTLLGSRTSPYSMRSERSNSPSVEAKNLRSGKPRKVKNNLLNEVVMKEQKKRRRLLSDSKNPEIDGEDCKKLKRGRSCSGEGSEVSKCSDNTESDLSMSETLNDSDSRELNKKLDKKTDIDVDIENNIQISTIVDKVPSLNVDSKAEPKPDAETSSIEKNKKPSLSLKRSTSLDADNNNSNRLKLETLNASDIEDKLLKTENDTLFEASRILTSMSKTFNSKDVTKNMKRARRGRKAASAGSRKPSVTQPAPAQVKNCTPTVIPDALDDKHETIETLSKDIDDLIKNLDQNIDGDHEPVSTPAVSDQMEVKSVTKFYGLNKPLSNVDNKVTPETPVKDKEISITNENTPSKQDDSENMRLHYDEDSVGDGSRQEVTTYNSYAIDKLMDRLKEFEEYDKRRQRLESESKSNDGKPMMVTNDVVLITKSGADIKPLKDIQSVRSPERPMEKENVLSCLENNSAISIVKRDQVRKSVDIDLPNSVTLIKRNSVSARKESTSSNHSRESDAISIFEKSLGKDVTLTEIRKSVDKSGTPAPVDLHQFATLHPTSSQIGAMLDSSQISITPRVSDVKMGSNDIQIISKRKSRESMSRKSSEPTVDMEEKLAVLEKIKTPPPAAAPVAPANVVPAPVAPAPVALAPVAPASVAPAPVAPAPVAPASVAPGPVASAPVAVKSPELTPVEPEALPPPVDNIKPILDDIPAASEIPKLDVIPDTKPAEIIEKTAKVEEQKTTEEKPKTEVNKEKSPEKVEEKPTTTSTGTTSVAPEVPKPENKVETKEIKEGVLKDEKVQVETKLDEIKPVKGPGRAKTSRTSIESQPGPSNALMETPETQKHKENVLRTLGLLTHKAANEAKIEKLKEKERIYSGMIKGKAKSSGDYTGTLKTVIKLNRSGGERERKKHRSSLKMTFQKSKYRTGKQFPEIGETQNEDETFYTIERREASGAGATDGAQRKSYSNRVNHDGEAVPEPAEPKETLNLVIPEKASSFSIHPGRLCQDQCFYCGGKFGLFDTPCHIAQIKSSERQKKVLDNEEKLTIDSCLCDACYRHVDRRANCPSYRKRPHKLDLTPSALPPQLATAVNQAEKPPSPTEEDSDEEPPSVSGVSSVSSVSGRSATCHTEGCSASADKSIRRKWLIKMRTSVNQVLSLKCDYPGLHTIPLCAGHHAALAPLMACTLCRRRLTKHHNVHFIHHGYTELNPALETALIPVQFTSRPVLCKGCRYYCSLLHRPGHNDNYAHGYRKKLLQIYNIEVPEMDTTTEITEDLNKPKKKQRNKSKQRKSTEAESNGSESSERTNDSTPEKKEQCDVTKPVEEDIESLISSNKIPVPNAKPNEPSDGSENDFEFEAPLLPLDKQTELQYLLQKQNNPAQFMNQPNLTQKQKNLMKLQSISGIQKPGQQHRISDKNARRIQKLGLMMAKEKAKDMEVFEEKARDPAPVLKNITLNEECTIESIPNKRPADINTLKNKWQMSESFTQVKRNLSELSKKLTVEKEPKKTTEVKYSNPVKRLETNPSISVRELFPGEDEMNLQCNIEFNNVKGVTPEGWEKCNTMIQYDVETKRLWHELQRPYGNQSSFLRHLVLLEKYFRSGDLVLSPNAAPHAMSYSDSVQNRLKAYDSTRKEPSSLLDFRKKPSLNGKSLLKSNQEDKDTKRFMPPPAPKVKKDKKSKQLPPELIAINTPNAQGRKAIQNVLHNIQQLVKGVSASDPTEVAAAPLPPKFEPPLPPPLPKEKKDVPKEKKDSPKIDSVTPAKTKSDTPKKSKTSSKPWRPTLMPITQENLSRIAREPTQIAVDGRALPSLVQVMSSGKRYHITLQDYNKMCIMRREKLQQLQDGDKKRPSISIDSTDNTIVTELQPSTMLGNGGSVTQVTNEEERKDDMQQIGSNAANILKNVGLKNITIAPILAKPQTVTSQTITIPMVSSPSLLVSTPIKIPQLSSSVTITSETVTSPLPIMASQMVMPKIPKSLTVIPQTVVANVPQNIVVTSPSILTTDGIRP